MNIFSRPTALFAALALCAAVSAYAGNKSDSATQGSSPGGQQSQQQSSSAMNDKQTVQQVQQALNAKGYDAGQANGNWSSKSRIAMSQFQKDNGLNSTGRIDQQSLALLGVTGSNAGAGGQQSKQPGSSDQQQGGYGMMGNQGGPGQQANPEQGGR